MGRARPPWDPIPSRASVTTLRMHDHTPSCHVHVRHHPSHAEPYPQPQCTRPSPPPTCTAVPQPSWHIPKLPLPCTPPSWAPSCLLPCMPPTLHAFLA
nr:hypothetical protein Iba_chr15bCG10810 [Ipomoea batatas]